MNMNANINRDIATLLLVDDDPDDQEFFKLALQTIRGEITFAAAGNGQEAFDLLRTQACLPDLIFLDMNMPLMNGLTFLEKIKATTDLKHIPVIIYTTSDEKQEMILAKSLGAVDFVTKPTRFDDLCQLLQEKLYLHVNA
ncbi:response regulator [Chitinophaga arvensicola]|uniref:Response regulator receiver domain-containing protein n=1 Tax=Chitinophaga arvensicola TaxID=29529 RepID=A0A1I0S6A6_9BACT|nr:response regulator [Chitinophaga arvensicola]SEW50970.1 Response regulator receiver domain-containing protein [Chitinophaga arvensicola]